MYSDLDYKKLKQSLAFFLERYMTALRNSKADPIRVLERMEKERPAMGRRGLIVAVADNVEALQDLPASEVRKLDKEMEKRGAFTFSFLRARLSRRKSGRGD